MATKDNTLLGINPVSGTDNVNRKLDIVFIHGLGGHAATTWGDKNKIFWPYWLNEDFDNTAVWTIGYDATPSAWSSDTMPMSQRGLNLLDEIHNTNSIGNKPLLFIVHSMGGLILKYLLEMSEQTKKYNYIVNMTKGIFFLATPHAGSYGASFLKKLNIIYRANYIVKELSKGNSELGRLDDSFCNLVKKKDFKCISFYETKEVRIEKKFWLSNIKIPLIDKKGLKIVSEESAKGRFPQDTPVPVDKDHINISKLQSKNDLIYRRIMNFISDTLNEKSIEEEKYNEILSDLEEVEEKNYLVNRIFLIFEEDNISNIKYNVVGHIQADNEFDSESIEFAFQDIYSKEEQESFVEKLVDEFESDVTIHFIIPPKLFLLNFKQWKYRDNELVKRYHLLLHNKDRFDSKIRQYPNMINSWKSLFDKHKDNILDDALIITNDDNTKFDTRLEKIGVCLKQSISKYEIVDQTIDMAKIGIWQYSDGIMANYHAWIESDIYLKELNHKSRECDHMALLWDDMSLLEELKRRI